VLGGIMSKCEMIDVMSSNISRIGFMEQERVLRIQFESGSIGDYFPVSKIEYELLMGAQSKGKYFARHIKPQKSYMPVKIEDLIDAGPPSVSVKNPTEKSLRYEEKKPRLSQTSERIQNHFTEIRNALRERPDFNKKS
jgi:KTSC domain-containing protein